MTYTPPYTSVCSSWATEADVCAPCNRYEMDTGLLQDRLLFASGILFNLTGRQWPGICTDRVRPCAEYGPSRGRPWWSGEVVTGGSLWGMCGCHADSSCGCNSLSVVRLPRRPVVAIQHVKIDGDVLDPAFYRVDNWDRLTYVPGAGDLVTGWPCCQDLSLPTTEDNTFEVVYSYGIRPPSEGVTAAAVFGCHLALNVSDPDACGLNGRIRNIARQGVTMATVVDEVASWRDGWTGLAEVDLFIAAEREARRSARPSRLVNPETWAARHRRTTLD